MSNVDTDERCRERKERIADIRILINENKHRLRILKRQRALQGVNTPAEVISEIENIEKEISKLQTELKLLDACFDETEIKKIAFWLLGRNTYEKLQGSSIVEKIESLIKKLAIESKLDRLVDYIGEFRPTLPLEDIEVKPAPRSPNSIEFVNRISEIQSIINPYCAPYLLISAPAGYGKTKLLEVLKFEFEQQSWLCIYVKFNRGQSYSIQDLTDLILNELSIGRVAGSHAKTPQDYGEKIASGILDRLAVTQTNCVLLLDEVEALDKQTVKQFLDEVIPALSGGLEGNFNFDALRVILAGRYIADWEQLAHEIRLEPVQLKPFKFTVVQDSVRRYEMKSRIVFTSETRRNFASHLMYSTGGHPGCMANILKGFRRGMVADNYLLGARGDKHYKDVIYPVIENIKKSSPQRLRKSLETLSVVRYFTPRLLRHFINTKLITWPKHEQDLAVKLTQTYTVERERGFLHDGVIRRMLAIGLRRTSPRRFKRICNESIVFYKNRLQNPKEVRPDIIAVELLFQKLQLETFKTSCKATAWMDSNVNDVLVDLTKNRDKYDSLHLLIDLLGRDWEFQFYFNYLLRDNIYSHEHPYAELKYRIESF